METMAIIGTGIAGMGAAHHLQRRYDLTLFEQNDYIGGHTNTISIDEHGTEVKLDTGFMVFNYVNYPNLTSLFGELQAPVKKTDMSFSVQYCPSGLEYSGSGIDGLFAQRRNLFSPAYVKMLMQITRFNKESVRIMDNPAYQDCTLGHFIRQGGYGEDMLWKYLIPMSSAVWSTPMEQMLEFPVVTLIRFFKNHGFLGLNTQHQWYTPDGGSDAYKHIIIKPFKDRIHIGNPVVKVSGEAHERPVVHRADGSSQAFDKVVFACHADQALRLLERPTDREQLLLAPFKYQKNLVTVHSDERVMPRKKKVWSSWNYRIEQVDGKLVPTTIYWMNRLQGVSEKRNYFVSVNALPGSVSPELTWRTIEYEHPLFDVPAMRAQQSLPELNRDGNRFYCGSYFRYGFHEDAYTSALMLSRQLLEP